MPSRLVAGVLLPIISKHIRKLGESLGISQTVVDTVVTEAIPKIEKDITEGYEQFVLAYEGDAATVKESKGILFVRAVPKPLYVVAVQTLTAFWFAGLPLSDLQVDLLLGMQGVCVAWLFGENAVKLFSVVRRGK